MPKENLKSIEVFSPAKVNLLLAVTSKRSDDYHNLISLVAPLRYGDTLWLSPHNKGETDHLECDNPYLDCGEQNLILRAASEYRVHNPLPCGFKIKLVKRIPIGSGLGGGSSNAVAMLKGLNMFAEKPLSENKLLEISIRLGSDCPLFLYNKPLVIRGRGEILETLPTDITTKMSGLPLLLFSPDYGISTAWAYRQFRVKGNSLFASESEIETKLKNWEKNNDDISSILFNSMEKVVFDKFLDLPIIIDTLRKDYKLACQLSGSGSACFALLPNSYNREAIYDSIHRAWGESAFIVESSII